MKPAPMPLVMEKVNGIRTMVRKAGMAISASAQSMSATCRLSRKPTTPRAGAAASWGMTSTNGVRNSATRNSNAVITLARPVRAPSPTPAADSMEVVLGEGGGGDAAPAAGRGDAVAQQHPAHPGQLAVAVEQAALAGHADDRSHGVEEVAQHEGEDEQHGHDDPDLGEAAAEAERAQQAEVGGADDAVGGRGDGQGPAGGGDVAGGGEPAADVHDRVEDDREDGRDHDAEQDGRPHPADHQGDGEQQAEREHHRWPPDQAVADAELDRD